MKIGDIVKDRLSHQYGIIVAKYKNSDFDWEIFALREPFIYGHIWQDCRKEKDLSLRSYEEYVKSLVNERVHKEMIDDLGFVSRLKLLFWRAK